VRASGAGGFLNPNDYPAIPEDSRRKLRQLSRLRGPKTFDLRRRSYDTIMTELSGEPQRQAARYLVRECRDLYFWFTYILRRRDGRKRQTVDISDEQDGSNMVVVDTPTWIYARCNELQDRPNGYLDLWAREHYKSSIGTFALTLMEVAANREITIGVFSFRSKSAYDFISQFKAEMETNPLLSWLFPETFWPDPQRQSPQWSTQTGLTCIREGNPRSATLEAHALEQGAPVGKHYDGRVYDDVVTRDSVIGDAPARTLVAWELSLALGKVGGWERYYGTRYAFNDAYGMMIKRRAVKPRIHEAELITRWCDIDTREEHEQRVPAFMPSALLDKKRASMGLVTYSCQMLLDPRGGASGTFNIQQLRAYDHRIPRRTVNVYLIVDPAKGKVKRPQRSDYTCMQVWAVGPDRNYYLLDMVHDRLNLKQRTDALFQLYKQWEPNAVGYEEYGLQADIEHIEGECRKWTFNIPIIALGGTKLSKDDRIEALIPLVDDGRIFLPRQILRRRVGDPAMADLVDYMINVEMGNWPAVVHDDTLDTAARLLDPGLGIVFPEFRGPMSRDIYAQEDKFTSTGWLAG